jgi:hypothetical protein
LISTRHTHTCRILDLRFQALPDEITSNPDLYKLTILAATSLAATIATAWSEDRTMDKQRQARYRVLKGAHITFKGDRGRSIVRSAICRTGAPASKWKVPSEFRVDLVLDHASVRTSVRCRVTGRKARSVLSSRRDFPALLRSGAALGTRARAKPCECVKEHRRGGLAADEPKDSSIVRPPKPHCNRMGLVENDRKASR